MAGAKRKQVEQKEETLGSSPSKLMTWKHSNQIRGGVMNAGPVCIHSDSKLIFVAVSSTIKVLSAVTGDTVRTLIGHSRDVTALHTNPRMPSQLVSSSLDGTVRIWDPKEGVLIRTIDLNQPITALTIPNGSSLYAVVGQPRQQQEGGKDKGSCRVLSVHIKTSQTRVLFKCGNAIAMDTDSEGKYVAVASGRKLHVHNTTTDTHTKLRSKRSITCVAVHPNASFVATGDSQGRIVLWYCCQNDQQNAVDVNMDNGSNNDDNDKKDNRSSSNTVSTTLHWHAHAVGALSFSEDGVYLYSGGEEAVLVTWQLDTGHKSFLPRLGAPITGVKVSLDASFLVVNHSNNSVRIIDAISKNTRKFVRGIAVRKTLKERSEGALDPRTGALAIDAGMGTLQLFNWRADRQEDEVEVVRCNHMPKKKLKRKALEIDLVAFDSSSEWMATIDRSSDGAASERISLKFFQLNKIANTAKVTALLFRPNGRMAVTASLDKKFKIWSLRNIEPSSTTSSNSNAPKKEAVSRWYCRSVGWYRDYVVKDASFCNDGSLLAVAYGQIITLWDPDTNSLLNTLSYVPPSQTLLRVRFAGVSPFVVSSSSTHVFVWNIVTCQLHFSLELSSTLTVTDPKSSKFAICTELSDGTGALLLYDTWSDVPEAMWLLKGSNVHTMAFTSFGQHSGIVYVNDRNEVHTIQLAQQDGVGDGDASVLKSQSQTVQEVKSSLEALYGKAAKNTKTKAERAAESPQQKKKNKSASMAEASGLSDSIYHGPSHTIPPVTKLLEIVTRNLLPRAPQRAMKDEQQRNESSAMDVEGGVGEFAADNEGNGDAMEVDTSVDQTHLMMSDSQFASMVTFFKQ